MDTSIINSLITIGTLIITCFANYKLMDYKISQLTLKVEKHNNFIERVYMVEGKIVEIQNDIKELKERVK